jgi:hypothetical protein
MGVPRWPAAVAILSIGASYLALSEYVTFGPRVSLPVLMTVLVVLLLSVHARGRYRLARRIAFVLLGVLTTSVVLRVLFLVTTLSGRGASASSVLVDAALIWASTVVTFAVWYWEIDGGGPAERRMDAQDRRLRDWGSDPLPDGRNLSKAERKILPTGMHTSDGLLR